MTSPTLGIDIGGTGIKGAPVDVDTGRLLSERVRILTPHPSTPDAVAGVVAQLAAQVPSAGPIGVTFPAAVKEGVTLTAANVDKSWVNTDASRLFRLATKRSVTVVNDADAAGIAEVRHGAAVGVKGVVVVLTLGTGIGCALFTDSVLVPNTELGHLSIRGRDAEDRASDAARTERGYSWKKWAKRLNEYLLVLEQLFWPDLIVIGGGAVKNADKFLPLLDIHTQVVPALLGNNAGIVGAAMVARQHSDEPPLVPKEVVESGPDQKAEPENQKQATKHTAERRVADLHAQFSSN